MYTGLVVLDSDGVKGHIRRHHWSLRAADKGSHNEKSDQLTKPTDSCAELEVERFDGNSQYNVRNSAALNWPRIICCAGRRYKTVYELPQRRKRCALNSFSGGRQAALASSEGGVNYKLERMRAMGKTVMQVREARVNGRATRINST
ncbi:hypothetical protein EVAR_48341_1 [Eumeta japonica]|uniref:Uncharacterized protein n=1 Tax=Eumeta variegata TaxID=151549 RepID=A0A4C1WLR8_EUMVA|nr:hypothetical protein EVAR_48341_1 [Eumeta japonica]